MSKLKRYSVNGVDYCYCRVTGKRITSPYGTPEFLEELRVARGEAEVNYLRKPSSDPKVLAYAQTLMKGVRDRARIKGRAIDISVEWIADRIDEQDGRCLLTGIRFVLENPSESYHNPFRPSLDRISPKGGYTRENVRVICGAVNTMLSDWGEPVLKKVAKAYLEKSGR